MASVNLVKPPAVEPITLPEACQFCRLNPLLDGTYADAALVTRMMVAARRTVETLVNRTCINTVWSLTLDSFPCGAGYFNRQARQSGDPFAWMASYSGEIRLFKPPLVSIDSIVYLDPSGDASTLDASQFRVIGGSDGPARVLMKGYNPWPVTFPGPGAVTITYTAGFGPDPADVPETIKLAILQLGSYWYYQPDGQQSGIPDYVESALLADDWGGGLG